MRLLLSTLTCVLLFTACQKSDDKKSDGNDTVFSPALPQPTNVGTNENSLIARCDLKASYNNQEQLHVETRQLELYSTPGYMKSWAQIYPEFQTFRNMGRYEDVVSDGATVGFYARYSNGLFKEAIYTLGVSTHTSYYQTNSIVYRVVCTPMH